MPLLPMMSVALAIAACPPHRRPDSNSYYHLPNPGLAQMAERSFVADLPAGFEVCRSEVGPDSATFEVRRHGVTYLELTFTAHPSGAGPEVEHIDPQDTGGVVESSPGGRSETLKVKVDGQEHLRLVMTHATKLGPFGPQPWYLIVEVSRDLSEDQAVVAERIAPSIRMQ